MSTSRSLVPWRPTFRTLVKRRSTWFRRSPYIEPGSTRLTVAEPPENARPPIAVVYVLLAAMTGPGTLCSVPLRRTSYHGRLYDTVPLTDVCSGSDVWQNGFVTGAKPPLIATSGSFARISQLSVVRRPVATPPEKKNLL